MRTLTPADRRAASGNRGWTNGEVLFHIVLAFQLVVILAPMVSAWGRLPRWTSRVFAASLDLGTPLFNPINAFAARAGARLITGASLSRMFDRSSARSLRRASSADDRTLARGMHYPSRWDPLFDDYMTLEMVLRYPAKHLAFHLTQLSR